MSDLLSLAIALIVVVLVGFGLYAGLTALRVSPKVAATIRGVLVALTGFWVIAFYRAMTHP